MWTFLRRYVRYAATVGWIDGRRGYPGEHDFVDLPRHGMAGAPAATPALPAAPAQPGAELPATARHAAAARRP